MWGLRVEGSESTAGTGASIHGGLEFPFAAASFNLLYLTWTV